VRTLEEKLIEESIVVALVCIVFLLHLRSALVAIIILPIAVLASFLIMYRQGISSNIMSLGGIAIAVGAMVDAVIIMIENAHKHIEHDGGKKPHWEIIRDASIEVGPTLFYSLLVITVSFIPVFTLQRRRTAFRRSPLRRPTQWQRRSVVDHLAPVLMGYFIRGKFRRGKKPINRFLIWLHHPCIDSPVKWRWSVVGRPSLSVGLLPMELAGHRASAGWSGEESLRADRKGISLSTSRLRIHAAALRRRSALHADNVPRRLGDQGARNPPADGQNHQGLPGGTPRLRKNRAGRDSHRPRSI
jgi:Cu/Ag efflux pump CusA